MNNLILFISSHDFRVSIISGLFVAFISGLVVYVFTDIFKKPHLTMVVKQNGCYRDNILLSKRSDGDYEASILFAIRNDGNKTFKSGQGYWHLYISADNQLSPFSVPGENNHQRDVIKDNIFAKSFVDIGHEWKFLIKKDQLSKADVPCFFSTDYGYFPKTVKMDKKTGIIYFKDMQVIGYEIDKHNT